MKKLSFSAAVTWLKAKRSAIGIGAGVAIVLGGLYLYRLGSHVRGDSMYESAAYLNLLGIQNVLSDVSYGPMGFGQYLMTKIDDPNATLLRLLSALVIVTTIIIFYRLIKKWHTSRIALLATALFATSTFSLHLGRFSFKEALLYLLIPSLLLAGTWLKSKSLVHRFRYAAPAAVFFLYIPGAVYILAALAAIFPTRLRLAWKFTSVKNRIIGIVSGLLIATPLIYSLLAHPDQLMRYLAIDRLVDSPRMAGEELLSFFRGLAYDGSNLESYRWLIGTPILDIATVVFIVLGIYAYVRGPHTLRARTLGLLLILSLFLIASSSLVSPALILPLLYIIVASGLAYLLKSWLTVFPRNPAAKSIAIILLTLTVGLVASYHLQRYFIAWPNSAETQQSLSTEKTP